MAARLEPLGSIAHGDDAPDMSWDGWGPPEARRELPAAAKQLIARYVRASGPSPRLNAADVALAPSAFDSAELREARGALAGAVGPGNLVTDHDSRLGHAGGKSLIDLLTRRSEHTQAAPDAIVRPADHDETQRVIEICSERRIALVPFGGGTSVVGGLTPPEAGRFDAVACLDLGRLTDLHELDEVSRTATLGAGLSGPAAERLLTERGYVIGHYPQSFEHATLGGFAATRSSGQASSGYGRFDSLVEWLRLATPIGTWDLGRAPASAAGPDLRQLALGSEGAFGAITALKLRVRPRPEYTRYEAWTFEHFEDGADAVRLVSQSGQRPTVLRLSDELESRVNFALDGALLKAAKRRCIAITTFEGPSKRETAARRDVTAAVFARHGGRSLGPEIARGWEHGRYKAPFWRDPALDAGVIVETFETACAWSGIVPLWRDVAAAVRQVLTRDGGRALVWAHISHQYPSGASLYFTAVAPAGAQPIELWRDAKRAAGDVIAAHRATITHHHAIGRDHQPWLADEIGPIGIEVLRSVKRTLDPNGVCNPGVLLPDSPTADAV